MNIELLQRVKQYILEEPNRLVMSQEVKLKEDGFTDPLDGYESIERVILNPPCGTTACIAGWCTILGQNITPEDARRRNCKSAAQELLELDRFTINRLYYTTQWPEQFYDAFKTTNIRKRAEVCAARIDHFIATDGQE